MQEEAADPAIPGVTSWNGNSPSTSNGQQSGNGKARITLVQEDVKYYIDLNTIINNTQDYSTSSAGKVDVYINGTIVSSGVTDFYNQFSNETAY